MKISSFRITCATKVQGFLNLISIVFSLTQAFLKYFVAQKTGEVEEDGDLKLV